MKPTLLVLNASGRVTRSLTHRLTRRFAAAWLARRPGAAILQRDFAVSPPPAIDECWIAAAFTPRELRPPEQHAALELSEALIAEVDTASAIVIGAPLYNFGMPAALKAWCDQIVRVDRTFAITDDATAPYRPLLRSKPVIVITTAGSAEFLPGGSTAQLNFLEPHLATVLGFIGLTEVTFVRVGDTETRGEAFVAALAAAETAVDALAA